MYANWSEYLRNCTMTLNWLNILRKKFVFEKYITFSTFFQKLYHSGHDYEYEMIRYIKILCMKFPRIFSSLSSFRRNFSESSPTIKNFSIKMKFLNFQDNYF